MKKAVWYTFATVLILGAIYAAAIAVRFGINRVSCETQEKFKLEATDIRFEVDDVSCDTIAKDEHIKVYAKKILSERTWFFPRWRNQRTLLFEYDPGRWDNPLPSITRPSKSTILISVPEISSIAYQTHNWDDMSVSYDIGQVNYPDPSK